MALGLCYLWHKSDLVIKFDLEFERPQTPHCYSFYKWTHCTQYNWDFHYHDLSMEAISATYERNHALVIEHNMKCHSHDNFDFA